MFFRLLKWVRVIVSVLFFLLIGFLFIDFAATITSSLFNGILFFQFVPSVLKFINLLAWTGVGFIIVLFLTLLFGRVYCSFLCPLGTLQDFLIRITRKFKKRKKFKFAPKRSGWRYTLLILALLPLIFGSVAGLNLLDPYSLFGKLSSQIARPVFYFGNNILVWIFGLFGNVNIYPVHVKAFNPFSLVFTITFFGLLVWMVHREGRMYCNTICPAGTFLGIISKVSLFKISLDQSLCTSCGICGSDCKAGCINTKERTVDFSRCIGCMNCLTSCTSGGVKFSIKNNKSIIEPSIESVKVERRNFIKNSGLIASGLVSLSAEAFSQGLTNGKIPVKKEYTVTPPGSLSIAHFNSHCTACQLCVSVCPTQVLQPSKFEFGLAGMMQPFMDYHTEYCNFECKLCSEVCPTGAILPIELEKKKLLQLGISKFIKENCVVYTDEKDCGACSEHCPTKAVNMVHYKDDLTIPEVTEDICIGCGACEYACPTTPKSIFVEGNPVHVMAEKPEIEKLDIEVNPEDDFPF